MRIGSACSVQLYHRSTAAGGHPPARADWYADGKGGRDTGPSETGAELFHDRLLEQGVACFWGAFSGLSRSWKHHCQLFRLTPVLGCLFWVHRFATICLFQQLRTPTVYRPPFWNLYR